MPGLKRVLNNQKRADQVYFQGDASIFRKTSKVTTIGVLKVDTINASYVKRQIADIILIHPGVKEEREEEGGGVVGGVGVVDGGVCGGGGVCGCMGPLMEATGGWEAICSGHQCHSLPFLFSP